MCLGTIAVLAAAALAGCGGDEAADAPTRAAANEKEADLGAEGPGWMYGDQFDDAEFLKRFNDAGRVARHELQQLTPPAPDRESMATMLGSIARMVKALDSRIAVLCDGREERSAVNAYLSGYTDLVTAAGALGLSECQGILL